MLDFEVFHYVFKQNFILRNFDFQVGAPQYLRVPSFRNCLGDHSAPRGSYSEFCLPAKKPQNCPQESWLSLQNPQVFSGIRCALDDKNGFGVNNELNEFMAFLVAV